MIWIAIGANIRGTWGAPAETFDCVLHELRRHGLKIVVRSGLYLTPPVGRVAQPDFLNAVIGVTGSTAPAALLRLAKALEAQAGRRVNGRWGPRPLDIDILDFGGRIIGQPSAARLPGTLVLPHPEITRRGFVLVPLAEVAPAWRHPWLGVGARTLLNRAPRMAHGIRRLGDWAPC